VADELEPIPAFRSCRHFITTSFRETGVIALTHTVLFIFALGLWKTSLFLRLHNGTEKGTSGHPVVNGKSHSKIKNTASI
jgi:hypothetical protein